MLAILLTVALTACGNDSAPGPDGTEDAGASEAGELRIPEDSLRVVGTSQALTLVRDLEIAPDGTVWVLDAEPPFLVAFDPEGGVLAEVGMQGDGPRELRVPMTLVAAGNGSVEPGIWVFDRSRHAMVRVTGTDTPADAAGQEGALGSESVRFPADRVPPQSLLSREGAMPSPIAWVGGGDAAVYVAPAIDESARGPAYWRTRLVELSLATGEARERWAMEDYLPDPDEEYAGITQFLPSPGWAICPTDGPWMYDPARHEVRPSATPTPRGSRCRDPAAKPSPRTGCSNSWFPA